MGADEALENVPQSRLVEKPAVVPILQSIPSHPGALPKREEKSNAVPAHATPIEQARTLAEKCTTLEALRDAVKNFDGCALRKTATNTVFADGNPQSRVMLVGEAPGANEDLQGIPFCGASGKLLDDMFSWIGLSRQKNFYITNTIFWRPPGNRRPTPEELAMCRPFVERHIALINPAVLILVGGTATAALLDPHAGITKLRGREYRYSNDYLSNPIPTFAIFHPSYLMRQPLQKRTAWHDLLRIRFFLEAGKLL